MCMAQMGRKLLTTRPFPSQHGKRLGRVYSVRTHHRLSGFGKVLWAAAVRYSLSCIVCNVQLLINALGAKATISHVDHDAPRRVHVHDVGSHHRPTRPSPPLLVACDNVRRSARLRCELAESAEPS